MGLRAWLGERIPVSRAQLEHLTNEPVPNHLKKWWWCLGGTPAYLFVVQIVTGIVLAFYYQPSPATAYQSIEYITNEAAFGWFIRSIHKWSATLMVAAVILHQIRVFFTGAYRKPREFNWMIGMGLLSCTVVAGFTGYSLVYEQLSYWGATVGANIGNELPIVGPFLKEMLLGGQEYNSNTLSRFYVLHAAVMPGAIIVLVMLHIGLVRLLGVSEFRFKNEREDRPRTFKFFPDHVMTELIIGLVLMVILTTLAIVFPATMGHKADALITPEVIKPEWYFYPTFRWLKLFPATVAVLSMGFIFFIMVIWPFIDALLRRFTKIAEISVWIGILGAAALIGFTVWEAVVAH